MKRSFKAVIFCVIWVFLLRSEIMAEESVLLRVKALQEVAKRSNGGAMGCGVGSFKLYVGKESKNITAGLDAIHVFGKEINIEDLKIILKSRIDSYNNKQSVMYGDFSDLCYVTLDTVKYGLDPTTIPILENLLQDPSGAIKGWCVISLIYMAENNGELKKRIEGIFFPQDAIKEAAGRGTEIPSWIKIK